jgi:PilZ domain
MNASPNANDSPLSVASLNVLARPQDAGGDGEEEATSLFNITARGGTLLLSRPPEPGQLLRLTLPTPRRTPRQKKKYLWALVWAVAGPGEEQAADFKDDPRHHVSVIFVGEEIPSGGEGAPRYTYLAEEDGRFRLQRLLSDARPPERQRQRRESRISIPVEVTIELINADGAAVAGERTVTENISRGGAAVWTSLAVKAHQLVRLMCERPRVSITAIVRARRTGPDGIARLHLEFVDGQWPLERME